MTEAQSLCVVSCTWQRHREFMCGIMHITVAQRVYMWYDAYDSGTKSLCVVWHTWQRHREFMCGMMHMTETQSLCVVWCTWQRHGQCLCSFMHMTEAQRVYMWYDAHDRDMDSLCVVSCTWQSHREFICGMMHMTEAQRVYMWYDAHDRDMDSLCVKRRLWFIDLELYDIILVKDTPIKTNICRWHISHPIGMGQTNKYEIYKDLGSRITIIITKCKRVCYFSHFYGFICVILLWF